MEESQLENYCLDCRKITTWRGEQVNMAGRHYTSYSCAGCDNRKCLKELKIMQIEYEQISKNRL